MRDRNKSRSPFNYGRLGVLVALVGACASEAPQGAAEFETEEATSRTATESAALLAQGEAIVEGICSTCHSMDPPPKLAPPLMMVLGHYMDEFGAPDSARDALILWLAGPDSTQSVLPAHAIERFGVMPPLPPLSDEQRSAVATYLFEQYEEDGMGGRGGAGMGQSSHRGGEGMRHGDTLPPRG